MIRFIFLLLSIAIQSSVFSQTDKNGNPVFNSELISEEKFDNFELTSNYYTIKNNISNKGSAVYVNDNPTLADYLKFARDKQSYFFIVHKGVNIVALIGLEQKNEGEKTTLHYKIINPNNGKSLDAPCNVWGEITEKRVEELEKSNIDTAASIVDMPNGRLYVFNGIGYRIQPYDKLKQEIFAIAKQLTEGGTKEEIKDPVEYIKKETIGGKLDYAKLLEKETQELFVHDGIAYNKKDFAIFLWGKKVKMLGIESSKKAVKLWEEINNRSLTDPEKKALNKGFEEKSD